MNKGETRTRSGIVLARMTGEEGGESAAVGRVVKRDPDGGGGGGGGGRNGSQRVGGGGGGGGGGNGGEQGVTERRVLRSRYLAVKNLINDERENISGQVTDKFKEIFGEVETLHNLVQKPREQVADAEALLDIANTIVASVRSQNNDGVTPSDFITSLLGAYPPPTGELTTENLRQSFDWTKFGRDVSHIFMKPNGCSTMLGPMSIELKQRQRAPQRKRTRTAESSRPEELDDADAEERTDTDKNMAIMFNILRRKRTVKLEALLLNRNSFAQTVENLFALSFLVKDGRVQISVDSNGQHLVTPKNAPPATAVASGEVFYSHFVFRLDFKDWKLMLDYVREGEELMPHRTPATSPAGNTQRETVPEESQAAAPTTPIRKLCRNRGLVIQEESIVEESPESNSVRDKAYAIRMDGSQNHAYVRRPERPNRVESCRPKRVTKCGRCRKTGHNKRTCERRNSTTGVLHTSRMKASRTPHQGKRTNQDRRGSKSRRKNQSPPQRKNPPYPAAFIDLTQSLE